MKFSRLDPEHKDGWGGVAGHMFYYSNLQFVFGEEFDALDVVGLFDAALTHTNKKTGGIRETVGRREMSTYARTPKQSPGFNMAPVTMI